MDDAVALTGMEYGGITPLGLPDGWPLLVEPRSRPRLRWSSGAGCERPAALPGALLAALPEAEVVEGLARPA